MILAALALALAAGAQNIPTVGDTTSPVPAQPGHGLILGPHEAVDPANGQVSLRFAAPVPRGRGLTPGFAFAYDSGGASFLESVPALNYAIKQATGAALLQNNGWRYTAPVLTYNVLEESPNDLETCDVTTDYVLVLPDGSQHTFVLSITGYDGQHLDGGACESHFTQHGSYSDGSGWLAATTTLSDESYLAEPVTVTSPDGTVYQFAATDEPDRGEAAATVTDRDGNQVSYAVNAGGALTLTDTIGRQAVATSGFGQASDSITVSGMTSAYAASWGSVAVPPPVALTGVGAAPCANQNVTALSGSGSAITQLTTPDGVYRFSYDATYGLLDKITYPGGGYVRYVWGLQADEEAGEFDAQPQPGNPPSSCTGRYGIPVVTDRYVSSNGSTEVTHQQFSYATSWDATSPDKWDTKSTTVVTTNETTGSSYTTSYTYTPEAVLAPVNDHLLVTEQMPVEQSVATTGTNVNRTVTEAWTSTFPFLVTDQYTTLGNGEERWTHNGYTSTGQLNERDEYDYGAPEPGPLLRQTVISYYPLGGNILDRPQTVIINGQSGVKAAETDYGYNGVGDLTSSSRWVSGGSFLTTTYTNDSHGSRLTAEDPAGEFTYYDYTDNWAGSGPSGTDAYVTTVTDALGHTDHYSWNYAGGTLAAHTDQNGQTTSFAYNDPWDRLTEEDFPDAGATTYAYTATTLETQRKVNASAWQENMETLDGLGRLADEATETAAGSWSHATTCYDPASGEPADRGYPFVTGSPAGSTYCYAPEDAFTYDALGRLLTTTHSDGSVAYASYAGRATERQDEGNGTARVTRITQVNALGQLTSVCEVTGSHPPANGPAPGSCGLDIAATGYLTSYSRNALGEVTGITQGGETRTAVYDGLGRLTSATTPESGVTTYTYDNDSACPAPTSPGDLVSRTDARGIRTCYQYDALHRLIGKSYSDGTPAAAYAYDGTSELGVNGLQNTIGRLSGEWTAADAGEVFSYDKVGRVQSSYQITPRTWGVKSLNDTYYYDLAGDLTEAAPSQGAILTQALDLDGEPLSLASNTRGTLISGVTYNARGQELGATLGNNLPESYGYDQRGRMTSALTGTATYYVQPTPSTGWVEVEGEEGFWNGTWDSGDVWFDVEDQDYDSADVDYDESSDPGSLAAALADAFTSSAVTVRAEGGSTLELTSTATGSGTNYALDCGSDSWDPDDFTPPSFQVYCSGMSGGADGYWHNGTTLYQLSNVTYAADGDLEAATDSVNGSWSYSYNDLNQMTAANGNSYGYDRYGNLWSKPNHTASFSGSSDRIAGASYDASGDLLAANGCTFGYDAEHRITTIAGCTTASYVYDAEGRRVNETVGGVVKEFIYGEGPQRLTVIDANQNMLQQETWLGGRYLGTDTPSGFYWAHEDELGTVRTRTNSAGALAETYTSLPYGDNLNQVGVISDQHFTGKYRDGETGLDNFGARYYSSGLGRFMTPDWSDTPEAVPYADLSNPQSLNPYSYVLNNPATATDHDGHFGGGNCAGQYPCNVTASIDAISPQQMVWIWRMLQEAWSVGARASNQAGSFWQDHRSDLQLAMMVSGPGEFAEAGELGEDVAESAGLIPRMTQFGWEGGASWRAAVRVVRRGGTIEDIAGKVPTRAEAESLLREAGVTEYRVDSAHGAPNPHDYPHINYKLPSGSRGTIRIKGGA